MIDGGTEAQPADDPSSGPTGYVARLLSVDPGVLDRLFAAALFLFFGVILAMTPQYRPDSQLFPLVIGVPSFILFGVLLLSMTSSTVSAFVGRFSAGDLFEFEERFSDDTGSDQRDDRGALAARRTRMLSISVWMVLLLALVVLVGFIPATVAFLLGFYLVNTDLGWTRSIVYTAICTVLIVLVFGVVMGMRFYEGILGVGLPF